MSENLTFEHCDNPLFHDENIRTNGNMLSKEHLLKGYENDKNYDKIKQHLDESFANDGEIDMKEYAIYIQLIRDECKSSLRSLQKEVAEDKPSSSKKEVEKNNVDKMIAVYEYFDSPEVDKFVDILLQKYIGETVNIDGEIITLIPEDTPLYRENFKDYILATISTESRWDPLIENEISSASAIWQWLVWNWGTSVEVSDLDDNKNLKWVTKSKLTQKENTERLARIEWKFTKPELRERTIPTRSSYETMLNRVLPKFDEIKALIPKGIRQDLLNVLPDNIVPARSWETPIGSSLESQIPLLMLDTITHNKTVENANWEQVWIPDFMKTILVRWNYWEMFEAYAIFHHTNVDKKTKWVFRKNFNEVKWKSQNLIAWR